MKVKKSKLFHVFSQNQGNYLNSASNFLHNFQKLISSVQRKSFKDDILQFLLTWHENPSRGVAAGRVPLLVWFVPNLGPIWLGLKKAHKNTKISCQQDFEYSCLPNKHRPCAYWFWKFFPCLQGVTKRMAPLTNFSIFDHLFGIFLKLFAHN